MKTGWRSHEPSSAIPEPEIAVQVHTKRSKGAKKQETNPTQNLFSLAFIVPRF